MYTTTNNRQYRSDKCPIYQVSFSSISCGTCVSKTKRVVEWRFGFTNKEAIDSGFKGTKCRGEEHEITLHWSILSGKRYVLYNGHQIYHDITKNESKFEYSWVFSEEIVLKIVAYAAAPLNVRNGWKQFDLFVNGMSFTKLPCIYMLGNDVIYTSVKQPIYTTESSQHAVITSDSASSIEAVQDFPEIIYRNNNENVCVSNESTFNSFTEDYKNEFFLQPDRLEPQAYCEKLWESPIDKDFSVYDDDHHHDNFKLKEFSEKITILPDTPSVLSSININNNPNDIAIKDVQNNKQLSPNDIALFEQHQIKSLSPSQPIRLFINQNPKSSTNMQQNQYTISSDMKNNILRQVSLKLAHKLKYAELAMEIEGDKNFEI